MTSKYGWEKKKKRKKEENICAKQEGYTQQLNSRPVQIRVRLWNIHHNWHKVRVFLSKLASAICGVVLTGGNQRVGPPARAAVYHHANSCISENTEKV